MVTNKIFFKPLNISQVLLKTNFLFLDVGVDKKVLFWITINSHGRNLIFIFRTINLMEEEKKLESIY